MSYLLDIFRVRGGNQHDWCFHGPPFPEFGVAGATLGPAQKQGTLAGEDVPFGAKPVPAWHSPHGPVLDLIDRFGPRLFRDRQVIPLISCRGYWRMHWWGLRQLLRNCGALVPNLIVFSHPAPEPWRTVGVFLKIVGKAPERSRLLQDLSACGTKAAVVRMAAP